MCWIGAAVCASNLSSVWSWAPLVAVASPTMTAVLMLFEAGLLAEWKNNHRYGATVCAAIDLSLYLHLQLRPQLRPCVFTHLTMAVWVGHTKEFQAYRARTSAFVPCPPEVYAKLPTLLRTTLFCDWALYRR